MNSRRLIAALMLLLLGMSCFLSTPVLSGEHPWDVDRTGGGGSSPVPPQDSTRVEAGGTATSASSTMSGRAIVSWQDLVGRLTVYLYVYHHSATRSNGLVEKGKAER